MGNPFHDAVGRFTSRGGGVSFKNVKAVRNLAGSERILAGGGTLSRGELRDVRRATSFGRKGGALSKAEAKSINRNFSQAQRRNAKAVKAGRARQG